MGNTPSQGGGFHDSTSDTFHPSIPSSQDMAVAALKTQNNDHHLHDASRKSGSLQNLLNPSIKTNSQKRDRQTMILNRGNNETLIQPPNLTPETLDSLSDPVEFGNYQSHIHPKDQPYSIDSLLPEMSSISVTTGGLDPSSLSPCKLDFRLQSSAASSGNDDISLITNFPKYSAISFPASGSVSYPSTGSLLLNDCKGEPSHHFDSLERPCTTSALCSSTTSSCKPFGEILPSPEYLPDVEVVTVNGQQVPPATANSLTLICLQNNANNGEAKKDKSSSKVPEESKTSSEAPNQAINPSKSTVTVSSIEISSSIDSKFPQSHQIIPVNQPVIISSSLQSDKNMSVESSTLGESSADLCSYTPLLNLPITQDSPITLNGFLNNGEGEACFLYTISNNTPPTNYKNTKNNIIDDFTIASKSLSLQSQNVSVVQMNSGTNYPTCNKNITSSSIGDQEREANNATEVATNYNAWSNSNTTPNPNRPCETMQDNWDINPTAKDVEIEKETSKKISQEHEFVLEDKVSKMPTKTLENHAKKQSNIVVSNLKFVHGPENGDGEIFTEILLQSCPCDEDIKIENKPEIDSIFKSGMDFSIDGDGAAKSTSNEFAFFKNPLASIDFGEDFLKRKIDSELETSVRKDAETVEKCRDEIIPFPVLPTTAYSFTSSIKRSSKGSKIHVEVTDPSKDIMNTSAALREPGSGRPTYETNSFPLSEDSKKADEEIKDDKPIYNMTHRQSLIDFEELEAQFLKMELPNSELREKVESLNFSGNEFSPLEKLNNKLSTYNKSSIPKNYEIKTTDWSPAEDYESNDFNDEKEVEIGIYIANNSSKKVEILQQMHEKYNGKTTTVDTNQEQDFVNEIETSIKGTYSSGSMNNKLSKPAVKSIPRSSNPLHRNKSPACLPCSSHKVPESRFPYTAFNLDSNAKIATGSISEFDTYNGDDSAKLFSQFNSQTEFSHPAMTPSYMDNVHEDANLEQRQNEDFEAPIEGLLSNNKATKVQHVSKVYMSSPPNHESLNILPQTLSRQSPNTDSLHYSDGYNYQLGTQTDFLNAENTKQSELKSLKIPAIEEASENTLQRPSSQLKRTGILKPPRKTSEGDFIGTEIYKNPMSSATSDKKAKVQIAEETPDSLSHSSYEANQPRNAFENITDKNPEYTESSIDPYLPHSARYADCGRSLSIANSGNSSPPKQSRLHLDSGVESEISSRSSISSSNGDITNGPTNQIQPPPPPPFPKSEPESPQPSFLKMQQSYHTAQQEQGNFLIKKRDKSPVKKHDHNSSPSSNECSLVVLQSKSNPPFLSTTDAIIEELKKKQHLRKIGIFVDPLSSSSATSTETVNPNVSFSNPLTQTNTISKAGKRKEGLDGVDKLKQTEPKSLVDKGQQRVKRVESFKTSGLVPLPKLDIDQQAQSNNISSAGVCGNIMSPSLSNNFMEMNGTDSHTEEALAAQEEHFSRQLQEKENYINELQSNLESLKLKSDAESSYTRVLAEYEKTMSVYIQKMDEMKQKLEQSEVEKASLMNERDQALEDLRNVESAFSDVHRKYERAKGVLENMKSNEETLLRRDQELVQKVLIRDKKIETLKEKAQESLEQMHLDYENKIKDVEIDNTRLRAQFRKMEMKLESLEKDVEQKAKENAQLSALCDDLINGQVVS